MIMIKSSVASGNRTLSNLPGEERSSPYRATEPPESIAAAKEEYEMLHAEILDIFAQLSARKVVGRVSDEEWREYATWRGKAVSAQRMKEARVSFLKHWIADHDQPATGRKKRYESILSLMADLVTVLEEIEPEHEDSRFALRRLIDWREKWLDEEDDD